MKVIRTIPSRVREFPIDGSGSDINEGAVVMPGVTADQDLSVLIKASGASADAVGLLAELHDFSVSGDSTPEDGAAHVLRQVIPFLPGCEVAAEYDQDTVLSVASYSAPTISITSIADNLDGSWVYVVSGTGIGQLGYCSASALGTLTLKSAFTTALDNTSKVVVIRRQFFALHTLNSDADKIIASLANGSLPWLCLRNEYKAAAEEGWIELDPTKHHDLQLSGRSPVFRAILSPRDTLFNPGS